MKISFLLDTVILGDRSVDILLEAAHTAAIKSDPVEYQVVSRFHDSEIASILSYSCGPAAGRSIEEMKLHPRVLDAVARIRRDIEHRAEMLEHELDTACRPGM